MRSRRSVPAAPRRPRRAALRRRLRALAVAAATVIAGAGGAGAQQCTLTVGNLEFSGYSYFSPGAEEAAGRITVRCDAEAAVPVEISIDAGAHGSGFALRQMRHAGRDDLLGYLIFTDAAMSVVWGDGTRGSAIVRRTVPPGSAVEVPVYGRIPPGQDVSAGRFSDRVTVRVDW